MEHQDDNIVMFPKWKSELEKTGLQSFKEKRFSDAVEQLRPLLNYEAASEDVKTGLILSLIEVGEYGEAEDLCQEQMKHSVEGQYYHYLHMYITILFQKNRYQELMDLLDEVFNSEEIPHQNRTQLWQMYEVSRKLLEDERRERGEKSLRSFLRAIETNNLPVQWNTFIQFKEQDPSWYIREFSPLLSKKEIHPIMKTAILEWFRSYQIKDTVKISKFGQTFDVVPAELSPFESDYIMDQIYMRLGSMEQNNPSMFDMVKRLLNNYFYVRYPIFPDEHEISPIVEALRQLGHDYLQIPYNGDETIGGTDQYKEEIELCNQHASIVKGEV